jgi:hypothetical protein
MTLKEMTVGEYLTHLTEIANKLADRITELELAHDEHFHRFYERTTKAPQEYWTSGPVPRNKIIDKSGAPERHPDGGERYVDHAGHADSAVGLDKAGSF